MLLVSSKFLGLLLIAGRVASLPFEMGYSHESSKDPESNQERTENRAILEATNVKANEQVKNMRTGFDMAIAGDDKAKKLYEAAFGTNANPTVVGETINALETGTFRASVKTSNGKYWGNVPFDYAETKGDPVTMKDAKFTNDFYGRTSSSKTLDDNGRVGTLIHEATHQLSHTGDILDDSNVAHLRIMKPEEHQDVKTKDKITAYVSNHNYHKTVDEVNGDKKYTFIRNNVENMHESAEPYPLFASLCSQPGALSRRELDLFARALEDGDDEQLEVLVRRSSCQLPPARTAAAKKATVEKIAVSTKPASNAKGATKGVSIPSTQGRPGGNPGRMAPASKAANKARSPSTARDTRAALKGGKQATTKGGTRTTAKGPKIGSQRDGQARNTIRNGRKTSSKQRKTRSAATRNRQSTSTRVGAKKPVNAAGNARKLASVRGIGRMATKGGKQMTAGGKPRTIRKIPAKGGNVRRPVKGSRQRTTQTGAGNGVKAIKAPGVRAPKALVRQSTRRNPGSRPVPGKVQKTVKKRAARPAVRKAGPANFVNSRKTGNKPTARPVARKVSPARSVNPPKTARPAARKFGPAKPANARGIANKPASRPAGKPVSARRSANKPTARKVGPARPKTATRPVARKVGPAKPATRPAAGKPVTARRTAIKPPARPARPMNAPKIAKRPAVGKVGPAKPVKSRKIGNKPVVRPSPRQVGPANARRIANRPAPRPAAGKPMNAQRSTNKPTIRPVNAPKTANRPAARKVGSVNAPKTGNKPPARPAPFGKGPAKAVNTQKAPNKPPARQAPGRLGSSSINRPGPRPVPKTANKPAVQPAKPLPPVVTRPARGKK